MLQARSDTATRPYTTWLAMTSSMLLIAAIMKSTVMNITNPLTTGNAVRHQISAIFCSVGLAKTDLYCELNIVFPLGYLHRTCQRTTTEELFGLIKEDSELGIYRDPY